MTVVINKGDSYHLNNDLHLLPLIKEITVCVLFRLGLPVYRALFVMYLSFLLVHLAAFLVQLVLFFVLLIAGIIKFMLPVIGPFLLPVILFCLVLCICTNRRIALCTFS